MVSAICILLLRHNDWTNLVASSSVYKWKDGRTYEGNFLEDQRNGLGEYKWPDGACYKGFFKAGHRDGEGTYRFAGIKYCVLSCLLL